MLKIVTELGKMRFSELMEVYREGNEENGAAFWPEEPQGRQLQLAEESFYGYLSDVFFAIPGARYVLWQEGERYISALRLEPYRDGLLLEALETRPAYRHRGYGSRLVRGVQEALGKEGPVRLYSHVSRSNAASMRLHLACGFRRVSDCAVYVDGSVNRKADTLLYTAGTE